MVDIWSEPRFSQDLITVYSLGTEAQVSRAKKPDGGAETKDIWVSISRLGGTSVPADDQLRNSLRFAVTGMECLRWRSIPVQGGKGEPKRKRKKTGDERLPIVPSSSIQSKHKMN